LFRSRSSGGRSRSLGRFRAHSGERELRVNGEFAEPNSRLRPDWSDGQVPGRVKESGQIRASPTHKMPNAPDPITWHRILRDSTSQCPTRVRPHHHTLLCHSKDHIQMSAPLYPSAGHNSRASCPYEQGFGISVAGRPGTAQPWIHFSVNRSAANICAEPSTAHRARSLRTQF
jgi:hypothetical protein